MKYYLLSTAACITLVLLALAHAAPDTTAPVSVSKMSRESGPATPGFSL